MEAVVHASLQQLGESDQKYEKRQVEDAACDPGSINSSRGFASLVLRYGKFEHPPAPPAPEAPVGPKY